MRLGDGRIQGHSGQRLGDGLALADLQAALEATDAFEYVQPNRLYEAKSTEGEPSR